MTIVHEIVLDRCWSKQHLHDRGAGRRREWMGWPGGGCHAPTVISVFIGTEEVQRLSSGIHRLNSCSSGKVGDRRRGGRRFNSCEVLTTFLVFLCFFVCFLFVSLCFCFISPAQLQCSRAVKLSSSATSGTALQCRSRKTNYSFVLLLTVGR